MWPLETCSVHISGKTAQNESSIGRGQVAMAIVSITQSILESFVDLPVLYVQLSPFWEYNLGYCSSSGKLFVSAVKA
jgi:hypothetical protein